MAGFPVNQSQANINPMYGPGMMGGTPGANPVGGGAKGGMSGNVMRADPYGYNRQAFGMTGLPRNYASMQPHRLEMLMNRGR